MHLVCGRTKDKAEGERIGRAIEECPIRVRNTELWLSHSDAPLLFSGQGLKLFNKEIEGVYIVSFEVTLFVH